MAVFSTSKEFIFFFDGFLDHNLISKQKEIRKSYSSLITGITDRKMLKLVFREFILTTHGLTDLFESYYSARSK